MNEFIHYLLFGWYPYLAVTVMVIGSILRFDTNQYSWRSQSSQFLRRKQMMIGSNMFHLGILVLLGGHFVGLLTPIEVFDYFGVQHQWKQVLALVAGGIAGVVAFIGCTLLLHRRLFDPRIRRSSATLDIVVLVLIWLQILLGLSTTYWTLQHIDGREMVNFMAWANGLMTLQPGSSDYIVQTHIVYKLHIVLGLTLFLLTPFTRLVHVFSAPIWYLFRPGYQIVRTRRGRGASARAPQPFGGAPAYTPGPATDRAFTEEVQ